MRFIVYLTMSLSLAIASVPSSEAQVSALKNFRISRSGATKPAEADSGQRSRYAGDGVNTPLTGGVEHQEEDTLVAPDEYKSLPPQQDNYSKPLSGMTDNTQLRSNAGMNQLRANTGMNQLRSGTDGFNLKSGLLDKVLPLIQGNPSEDALPPLPKLHADVNNDELKVLKSRDIVIMQDRSSSMGERENFPEGMFPRWYWCLSQAMDFRRQSARIPDWTFNLVMFSSQFDVYRSVRMEMLPTVFSRNHIWIGTKLAEPMAEQLGEYFQKRGMQKQTKPLVVAVITDGKPQDEGNLKDVIINATHQMRYPSEVQIVFLQVGTDDESYKKLSKLDNRLVSNGAKYDIVSVMPFNEVTHLGLARALVRAVQSTAQPQMPRY